MTIGYKMIGGDGREYGPASLEEIRQWSADGRLGHGTPVWRSDESRWQPAAAWPELKWDLQGPAPMPEAAAPPVLEALLPAGFWVRGAAYFVDWLVLSSLVIFITLPWAEPLGKTRAAAVAQFGSATPDVAVLTRVLLVSLAIEIPVSFLYFVGFNTARGATPGKQMFGLRVLNADGSRLTFGRALVRHCGEWLSKLTFGLGFLMVLRTPQKRALHDLLARTQVVFLPRADRR